MLYVLYIVLIVFVVALATLGLLAYVALKVLQKRLYQKKRIWIPVHHLWGYRKQIF